MLGDTWGSALGFFIMIDIRKKYTAYGHVDSNGKLSIYNSKMLSNTLKDYFKKTSVEIIFTEKQLDFSDSLRAYYFAVVVKEVQKALRASGVIMSLKDIDLDLRSKFLFIETYNEDKGLWEKENHTLKKGDTKVTRKMMREFIDLVIIWSIQNLDWAIPYPSEILDDDDLTIRQKLSNHLDSSNNNTF